MYKNAQTTRRKILHYSKYKEVLAILVSILLYVVVKVILGGLGESLFTTTNWTTGMYSVTVLLQALAKTSPYVFVR